MKHGIHEHIRVLGRRLLPRILTQICRDGNIPLSGACDRNYWHYKIRDFSSVILQQAGYTVWTAIGVVDYPQTALERIGAECCRFWNQRAQRFRAFEEYYPWESGYPPLAFSALAVAKMTAANLVPREEMFDGFRVAARQLIERFESKATNQQVAGMAALCWVRKIYPELVSAEDLEKVVVRTLACQHAEGWYMEYGGPDLGYLSVTMDCLWDAYDATGDSRFVESARKALMFIWQFIRLSPCGIGMHNARNTDYIVPYGIARFLRANESSGIALGVLTRLLRNVDDPGHYFNAVDDRYWCHYIGASFYRAIPLLQDLPMTTEGPVSSDDVMIVGTGHFLRFEPQPFRALVSTKKGGVFTLYDEGGRTFSDFGWVVVLNGIVWTNHWWDDAWRVTREEDSLIVSGGLTRHKYLKNTPFRHMVLRLLSFSLGNRIISLLKQKMIFKAGGKTGPTFTRKISFLRDRGTVVVNDSFRLPKGATNENIRRAPRASQRHVASADSFHYEDFNLAQNGVAIARMERMEMRDGVVNIETIYSRKNKD